MSILGRARPAPAPPEPAPGWDEDLAWPPPYGLDPAVFGPPGSGQGRDGDVQLVLIVGCGPCGTQWRGNPSRCWCCGQPATAF